MTVFNINHFKLGESTQSGHKVYQNARYFSPESSFAFAAHSKRMVVKENKYNKPYFSQLEVAFSKLAQLFLARSLTSSQKLVVDDSGAVVGVAVDHLCYVVAEKEGFTKSFYNVTPDGDRVPKKVARSEDIPLYFLNQFPAAFFARLLKTEQEGSLTINYASLASILTSSYTLEEDDLHKGNFGFYLVEKNAKPEVVFFKIDHDLMFANTIMSFYSIRPQHIFFDDRAFDMTAEDVMDFPNLHHSANTYWPTKHCIVPTEKGYHSRSEIDAFAGLGQNPEFKKAKWLAFYKHILVPTELTELVLAECLDSTNAKDRAQIALMAQAVSARQARLKSLLFSLPEFRDFISQLSKQEKSALTNEVLDSCPDKHKIRILSVLTHSVAFYDDLCCKSVFEEGDTPLHTAIKLGDFRYEETLSTYGHLVNVTNKAGKTPLDVCLELVSNTPSADIRKDVRLTMKYLLKYGAHRSAAFNAFNEQEQIDSYKFKTSYMNRVHEVNTYDKLKELLRDIGEDHSYCLKFKKKLVVECVKQFINSNGENPHLPHALKQLKQDISTEVPELKYIRQLRSRLWIIRQIRGLYGWTTTQGELNALINPYLQAKTSQSYSLFSTYSADKILPDPDSSLLAADMSTLL